MSQDKQTGSKLHGQKKSKAAVVQPVKKAPAAKRRLLEKQEDEASLVEDYRQLKKLKNGHISEVCEVWHVLLAGSHGISVTLSCHDMMS